MIYPLLFMRNRLRLIPNALIFEKYKLFTRDELAENTNVIIDVCRHYANSR